MDVPLCPQPVSVSAMLQTVAPPMIHALPLFDGLSGQEKNALIQGARTRRCSGGHNLFVHGDPIHHFYIVCDGTVQIFRETPDGHEITTDILIAGDMIGEMEILQRSLTHQWNALVIKDSVLLEFPVAWFWEKARHHGALAFNLLTLLSQRADRAALEAEHRTMMTAPQQLVSFLLRLCLLQNLNPHSFDLPYSKTLIASRLGMELETLSRALTKIQDHGVTVQGTRVSFDNMDEIKTYVCSNCSAVDSCVLHDQLYQKWREQRACQV